MLQKKENLLYSVYERCTSTKFFVHFFSWEWLTRQCCTQAATWNSPTPAEWFSDLEGNFFFPHAIPVLVLAAKRWMWHHTHAFRSLAVRKSCDIIMGGTFRFCLKVQWTVYFGTHFGFFRRVKYWQFNAAILCVWSNVSLPWNFFQHEQFICHWTTCELQQWDLCLYKELQKSVNSNACYIRDVCQTKMQVVIYF